MSFYNPSAPIFPDTNTIQDEISQLQEVAAIAPLTQTTRAITRWQTSDPPGVGSEHNLLKDTPGVILSDAGDVNNFNSITFNSNTSIPSAGSLWLKDDGHLYHGLVDLEAGGGGGGDVSGGSASVANEVATYTDTSGKSIGRSNIVMKLDTATDNLFISGGPIPTITGGVDNVIITNDTITSPLTTQSNVFVGTHAGAANASDFNVAIGTNALLNNSDNVGSNIAVGSLAFRESTVAQGSTAVGASAGQKMVNTFKDVVIGQRAGYSVGGESGFNCLIGASAAGFDTTTTPLDGFVNNTMIGCEAGYSTGITGTISGNVMIGKGAGGNMTNNSDCIYIGSVTSGVADENGVIRIGVQGIQDKNFQSGIFGVTTDDVDAIPVLVSSFGQLGTVSSSIKYKENIKEIDYSDIIYKLKPVEFNYITQPSHKSLGLIAEDVETIYPEMCIYHHKGTPKQELLTVDYNRLTMLMLSEIQQLKYQISTLKQSIIVLLTEKNLKC